MQLPPLIVDLDGTLTLGDGLVDAVITVALRRPAELPAALVALKRGKAAFKDHLWSINAYPVNSIPLRPGLISYLEAQHAAGREIHLVTASPQPVADAIAKRVGYFASATGSSNGVNLKGEAKAAYLAEHFPNGFVYAGNDVSDLAVWKHASAIITVDTPAAVRKSAHLLGPDVEHDFPSAAPSLKTWLRLMRVHQWAKNALMFVPLLLAHKYTDAEAILAVVLGFMCMGLVASATYILNDLGDLEADRQHATKSRRPLASAAISVKAGIRFGMVIGTLGFVGAVLLDPAFAGLLALYIALTLSYSLKFKTMALLDVFILGLLYMLRIQMGSTLIGTEQSPWLLVFSLFFFFSLSMAKRHVEIVKAAERGLVGQIKGRGYFVRDEPVTLALGVSASLAAILLLFLYLVNDAYPAGLYQNPQFLWVIGPLVFLWCGRIWLKSHRGDLHDDPVVFAIKDKPSWIIGLAVLCAFIYAVV
jgi:4-hydroxybenzoate polyprenyltransferase/phosphoserine phosphatase